MDKTDDEDAMIMAGGKTRLSIPTRSSRALLFQPLPTSAQRCQQLPVPQPGIELVFSSLFLESLRNRSTGTSLGLKLQGLTRAHSLFSVHFKAAHAGELTQDIICLNNTVCSQGLETTLKR